MSGPDQAEACRLHNKKEDGTWTRMFTWETAVELFIGKDKSRRQQRTEWATKTLGKVLEGLGVPCDPIRSEGIVEVSKAAVLLVDCSDAGAAPRLKWKMKLAAELKLPISDIELEFSRRTSRRDRRANDPNDPWG